MRGYLPYPIDARRIVVRLDLWTLGYRTCSRAVADEIIMMDGEMVVSAVHLITEQPRKLRISTWICSQSDIRTHDPGVGGCLIAAVHYDSGVSL